MNRQAILKQLEDHGFCVLPNVIPTEKCDEYLQDLRMWYTGFDDKGERLRIRKSVIQSYRIGQFDTVWKCRLHCKPVFDLIWGTEKLFSSVDGVALANPPEEGRGDVREPDTYWLHLDQSVKRQDLHAYQGAVYLEETTKQDYCFRVLKQSHKHHSEFFKTFPDAAEKSRKCEFYKLGKSQRKWYEDHDCPLVYVPVPKGGMVLWDSRTVHDTDPPEEGRPEVDKWRCVVFVSMTPAILAGENDISFKQEVYKDMLMTSHWSSQCQKKFTEYKPKTRKRDGKIIDTHTILELPPTAKTAEVKLLMGVDRYNFVDGKPNGPPPPTWIS